MASHRGLTPSSRFVEILERGIIADRDLNVQKCLGNGSFGTVHEALCFDIPVAVKEFFYDDHFDIEYKLFRELMGINSSHIVQILGESVIKSSGRKALVMEVMNMDLRRLMEIKKKSNPTSPFSVYEATDIMLQVASGMRELHRIDVIHRDIKPSNILVSTRKDGSFIVKLADFGLSRTNFRTQYTYTDHRGTEMYMAPEMKDERGKYTRNVDAYSFGVVYVEIFTGRLGKENIKKHKLLSLRHDIPSGLSKVICGCLEQEAKKRPSFKDICNDLWNVMERLLMLRIPRPEEMSSTMASASNPSLIPFQLRNKYLCSKLKLICKAAAQVDPQLIAATAQIISQLTHGVPVDSHISQVITFLVGTAAASFGTFDKLNVVQLYADELQRNIHQLPTADGEMQRWICEDALPKLYAEAYSLNKSRQGCTCIYKLLCAQHINAELDRLHNTLQHLNYEVNHRLMLNRQEKPCPIPAGLPASVDDILAGKNEVLEFLNIGKPGIRVLCIIGMGGVGKTTMMDALQHLILQKTRPVTAKVEIGKDLVMPLTQIQQKIVHALEEKNESFNSTAQGQKRLETCFNTLKGQNRPLCLCIDNIWKETHLLELFNDKMYKNLPSSSYLILTTRKIIQLPHSDNAQKRDFREFQEDYFLQRKKNVWNITSKSYH